MAAIEITDARLRWRAAPVLGALIVLSVGAETLRDGRAPSRDTLLVAGAWIVGLTLALIAARLVRRHQRAGAMATRGLVIGAAVSAAPSVVALLRAAADASHPIGAIWHALFTVRLAPLFSDLNAGGSYFAMFAATAVWISVTAPRPWRWAAPTSLLLLALWLTGSRTALASVLIVLPCTWILVRRPGRPVVIIACLAVLAILSWVVFAPPTRVPQASSVYATRVRVDMGKVALAVAGSHPWFGVGLGRFQAASTAFIAPELIAYFPPAALGENAHNNFLQILAELGVSGLAAFLWWIAPPLRATWRTARRGRPELVGLTAGVSAFLLTCLAGHPLLSPPITLSFLLAVGVMYGLAAADSPS